MGDAEKVEVMLRGNQVSPGFIRPNYTGFGLSNLPSTISSILTGRPLEAPVLDRGVVPFDSSFSTVIVLLVDGFGWKLAKSSMRESEHLKAISSRFPPVPLTTAFPSTTSTVLSTLSTGKTPAEHGVVGYSMYLKELGAIANMLDFKIVNSPKDETIFEKGVPLEGFLGSQTIYQSLAREGVQSFVITKNYILSSGLSRLTHAGSHTLGYIDVGDMFVALRKLLETTQGLRKYVFMYWPSVDTASHSSGPWSEETTSEVRSLFFSMQEELFNRLPRKLKKDTLLMVTADHGQVQVDESGVFDTSLDKTFMDALVMPPTGDSRTSFLHVKGGMEEDVKERLRARFGDAYRTFRVKDSIEMGLFGAGRHRRELQDRLGDLMVLAGPGRAMFYPFKPESQYNQRGAHSGLVDDEILVPLFCIPLEQTV